MTMSATTTMAMISPVDTEVSPSGLVAFCRR